MQSVWPVSYSCVLNLSETLHELIKGVLGNRKTATPARRLLLQSCNTTFISYKNSPLPEHTLPYQRNGLSPSCSIFLAFIFASICFYINDRLKKSIAIPNGLYFLFPSTQSSQTWGLLLFIIL